MSQNETDQNVQVRSCLRPSTERGGSSQNIATMTINFGVDSSQILFVTMVSLLLAGLEHLQGHSAFSP